MSITQELTARSQVYRSLASLYQREVDDQQVQELQTEPLMSAWKSVGGVVPKVSDVEDLAIDFCQIFLGPKNHLPPYQSVWESGQFCADASKSMREYIEITRYQADGVENGMFDHLAIQLDLMAHILEQIHDVASSDPAFETLQSVPQRFLAEHLQWPKDLLRLMEKQAETAFYRSLARVTQDFLTSERGE